MASRSNRPPSRVGLRPAAQAVNTYVAPEQSARPAPPPQQNGWNELSTALQSVAPSLGQFLEHNKKKNDEEDRSAAQERIAALSFSEMKRLRENGELNLRDSPVYNSAMNQFYGQKVAAWRSEDLERRIQGTSTDPDQNNAFDHGNGSFDQFWTDNVNEDLAALKGKDARQAYLEGLDTKRDRLYRLSNKVKDDLALGDSVNAAGETFLAYTETTELDAAGILSNVTGAYKELHAKFGLDDDQLNSVFLQILSRRAEEGRYDLVSEALRSPLKAGGTALIDQVDHMGTAAKILDIAQDKQVEELSARTMDAQVSFKVQASQGQLDDKLLDKFSRENPDVLSEAQIINLKAQNDKAIIIQREKIRKEQLKQRVVMASQQDQDQKVDWAVGKLSEGVLNEAFIQPTDYLKKDGTVGTWTPKQLVEKAVNQYLYEESPRIAKVNRETPEQTFDRELGIFETNGLENPRWKSALESGAYAVSTAALAQSPEDLPPALLTGYATYQQLQVKNPQLLKRHLSDPTAKDIYETARIGEKYLGLDLQQSMYAAVEYVRNPEMEDSPVNRPRFTELQRKTDELADISGWSEAKNWSKISSELNRTAKFYVSRGLSVDAALTEAQERFKENFTPINGWYTYTGDTQIQNVPQTLSTAGATARSFQELAEERIEAVAQKSGFDTDNLSLRIEGGQVTLTQTVAGQAGLPAYGIEGYTFSIKSLLEDEMKRQQKERDKAMKAALQEAADRDKPYSIELFQYQGQPVTLDVGKVDLSNAFTKSTWRPKDPKTGEPLEPQSFYLKDQTLKPNFDTSQ